MTTKKATTKRRAARRPSVKERARQIIADAGRYDEETREAVRNALEEGHDDLAEIVRRAESGETVLDLTTRRARALTEQRARTLADVLAPHDLYQMSAELRAAALVELVGSLADEPDANARWMIAHAVSTVAYTNTEEFGGALDGFVSRMRGGAFDQLLAEERRRNKRTD
jgi:KaiC/GvpD/RAD55 family RecA-like ATPase